MGKKIKNIDFGEYRISEEYYADAIEVLEFKVNELIDKINSLQEKVDELMPELN